MKIDKADLDYLTAREERLYELRDEIKTAEEHLTTLQEERRIIAREFHDIGGYSAYAIAKMTEVSETSVGRWIRDK